MTIWVCLNRGYSGTPFQLMVADGWEKSVPRVWKGTPNFQTPNFVVFEDSPTWPWPVITPSSLLIQNLIDVPRSARWDRPLPTSTCWRTGGVLLPAVLLQRWPLQWLRGIGADLTQRCTESQGLDLGTQEVEWAETTLYGGQTNQQTPMVRILRGWWISHLQVASCSWAAQFWVLSRRHPGRHILCQMRPQKRRLQSTATRGSRAAVYMGKKQGRFSFWRGQSPGDFSYDWVLAKDFVGLGRQRNAWSWQRPRISDTGLEERVHPTKWVKSIQKHSKTFKNHMEHLWISHLYMVL